MQKGSVPLIATALCSLVLLSLFSNATADVDRSYFKCTVFDENGHRVDWCGRAYCKASCRCRTNPRTGKDEFRITCDDTRNPPKEKLVRIIGGYIMQKNSETLEWEDKCGCFPFTKPDIPVEPVPRKDSSCCTSSTCKTWGCQVNGGRIDALTPCDPTGKRGPRTWVKCENSGCDGKSCGKCWCEKVTGAGGAAGIDYDIAHTALFYADGPAPRIPLGCLWCGNPDVGKWNCLPKGAKCSSDSQCCKRSLPPGEGKCSGNCT